jgi:hypothetical protein
MQISVLLAGPKEGVLRSTTSLCGIGNCNLQITYDQPCIELSDEKIFFHLPLSFSQDLPNASNDTVMVSGASM